MNNTINKQIEILVKSELDKLAYPTIVTITKVYNDGYVDVENDTYGKLKYIPTITSHIVGDTTVLIFCDNSYSERIVI